jgi:hypothetical protein
MLSNTTNISNCDVEYNTVGLIQDSKLKSETDEHAVRKTFAAVSDKLAVADGKDQMSRRFTGGVSLDLPGFSYAPRVPFKPHKCKAYTSCTYQNHLCTDMNN